MGCGASAAKPTTVEPTPAKPTTEAPGGLAPERLEKLKAIFKSMDTDGDGSVDIAEYRAATDNQTMLNLFKFMDGKGNNDGSLDLDEWLTTMSKVGLSMSDEQFEKDLGSMIKESSIAPGLAPERLQKLKEIFVSMDTDGDGSVDLGEYRAATSNPTMLKLFEFMDGQGNGDGSLSLDEWLGTMSKVGGSMTDEQFETDLVSMLRMSKAGGAKTEEEPAAAAEPEAAAEEPKAEEPKAEEPAAEPAAEPEPAATEEAPPPPAE